MNQYTYQIIVSLLKISESILLFPAFSPKTLYFMNNYEHTRLQLCQ